MNLLHEYCEGYIASLDPENYGLCEKCGEEGLFRVVREAYNTSYAVFHEEIIWEELISNAIGLDLGTNE
ncbi:MAG: hypothetical protein AUG51_02765 [Acidobacteria bacterium 13_1_20CM_3_53_8]|nr:MAG: hypothetical protein AUG51_02765 [Acidobacteria bacterium 13_1_20CM_3_53_8]